MLSLCYAFIEVCKPVVVLHILVEEVFYFYASFLVQEAGQLWKDTDAE